MIRIAVDSLGGDHAPGAVLEGMHRALAARRDLEVILVGNGRVRELVGNLPERVKFVRAKEEVRMDEEPLAAFRQKKDCTLAKGLACVRQGLAEGFFSAGNTGAIVLFSLFVLGREKGIFRPALASFLPIEGGVVLVDSGANAECRPEHLLQFAQMGTALAQRWYGKEKAAVGLINIGEEVAKGGQFLKKAYQLLQESELHFVGNIEPDVIFSLARMHEVPDVLVCEGRVGNLLLKFAEGLTQFLFFLLKEELQSSVKGKVLGALLRPNFLSLARRLGYERSPCAPLLGVAGTVTVGHGKSSSEAIGNALLQTADYIASQQLAKRS